MDDVPLVGESDRAGELLDEPGRVPGRPGRPVEPVGEAATADEFQFQVRQPVGLADLEDLDDVRVPHPGRRPGLGQEPGEPVRSDVGAAQDHLQGDRTVERLVPGLVDDPHPAAAQHAEDLVPRDDRPRRRAGRGRDGCAGDVLWSLGGGGRGEGRGDDFLVTGEPAEVVAGGGALAPGLAVVDVGPEQLTEEFRAGRLLDPAQEVLNRRPPARPPLVLECVARPVHPAEPVRVVPREGLTHRRPPSPTGRG